MAGETESHPIPAAAAGDAAKVYWPQTDDWEPLVRLLTPGVPGDKVREPLRKIFEVVRSRGCKTVVVEHQYIDSDFRSEFSLFWSHRFEERRSVTQRLHFFSTHVEVDELHELPEGHGYLGYSVMRPTRLGPVGRTVVVPSEEVRHARLTTITERPSLFGNQLEVTGVPFCQQDAELLRCAHATAWMCHYVAAGSGVIARRLTADIATMPSADSSVHRPLPSTGLTGEQMQRIFSAIGLPAWFRDIEDLPDLPAVLPRMKPHEYVGRRLQGRGGRENARREEQIDRVVCKYINSGFPVVVFTEQGQSVEAHTFAIVGWQRKNGRTELIACDDQIGPYEVIKSPFRDTADHRSRWKALMLPLPEKAYLTGEAAETRARNILRLFADLTDDIADLKGVVAKLSDLRGNISVRARLIEGRKYKAFLAEQGRSSETVQMFRLAHLPHWVWVIEFQDRTLRSEDQPEKTKPCVVAEVVFDSTSHSEDPRTCLIATRSISADLTPSLHADPSPRAPVAGTGKPWWSIISQEERLRPGPS